MLHMSSRYSIEILLLIMFPNIFAEKFDLGEVRNVFLHNQTADGGFCNDLFF